MHHPRRGPAFAAVLCAAALLAGCAGEPDSQTSPQSSAAGPGPAPPASQQPFTLISSPDQRSYGSGNRFGYYGVFENQDGSRNILYTDYATAAQVILCEQPNCNHDTASCASWIAPGPESVIAAASDEHLFLLTSSRGGRSYIEQCGLDGTNRHMVCEFAAGTALENAVAANGPSLIVSAAEYGAAGDAVEFDAKLLRIDLANGRAEPLFSLAQLLAGSDAAHASMQFSGVCEAGCILDVFVQQPYEADPDDLERTLQNQSDALIRTVYCVPWDGSAARALVRYPADTGTDAFYDGWLFLARQQPDGRLSLAEIDPASGQSRTVVGDLHATFLADAPSPFGVQDLVLRGLVDRTLLMNLMTHGYIDPQGSMQAVYTGVCVDLDTAAVYELTLTNEYHATVVPVEVLASAGDQLLVLAEISESPNPCGMAPLERKSALIPAEDFLASRPSYRMIESLRYYP